jgi:16S rRNA processing protein RimM
MKKQHLEVGYVARAHGLDGEVGVKTFDPGSEALFEVERVLLRLRDGSIVEMTIDSVRAGGKEILLAFEGVERRVAAERLVGSTVCAFREDLGPLREGEYFQGDLVGLKAFDLQGGELGSVVEVWSQGEVPNLVIRGEGKPELIVPFVDQYVPRVEMEEGRVVIVPPEFTDA